ncbi:meiotically up-regulated gene 113-domain-containing protein [Xylogone sp. PMI_703]|nr:meiotically up-regulated gene 113-domain-containing protein [Xylogone sp. PMI_703]
MPFIPNTPESLIQRSDFKNPELTCCGLTSNGRPCRRPLGKTRPSPPGHSSSSSSSESQYCWQHMDQASTVEPCGIAHPGLEHSTIKERTSVDTLVDRLGLLQVESGRHSKHKSRTKQSNDYEPSKPPRSHSHHRHHRPQPQYQPQPTHREEHGLFSCCTGMPDDDKKIAPRPTTKVERGRTTIPIPKPAMQQTKSRPSTATTYVAPQSGSTPERPSLSGSHSSQTKELVHLVSKAASPKTAALLLTELSKPISEQDEPGYIYMFWLTPESLSTTPPSEIASSLLETPPRPHNTQRKTSDVLRTFAASPEASPKAGEKKTMLLKIGRAQNVQRRLNEWSRQCGYNITLIRYYPYTPSTPGSSPGGSAVPRKVPCVHKVERLIHIELNEKRVRNGEKCPACGKEHREWFTVDASKDGVREVDHIIRRWIEWGERQA